MQASKLSIPEKSIKPLKTVKASPHYFNTGFLLLMFFLASCSTPYYSSVNNMNEQPASLVLTNGSKLNGKISVRTFDNYSSVSRIQFSEGASHSYSDYFLSDIKSVYINGSTYCVKIMVGSNFWGGNAMRFVKQLTPPGGRMELYQHEVVNKNSQTGKTETIIEYYLQLPGKDQQRIYNLESGKFTPDFHTKMSAYVEDCPQLAAKIKAKERDYFYPFIVNNGELRRKAVLLQIINDYNNCK